MGKILIIAAVRIISTATTLSMEQLIGITAGAMLFALLIDISVIAAEMEM